MSHRTRVGRSPVKSEGTPTKPSVLKPSTSPLKAKSYDEFTKKGKNMEVLVAVLLSSKKPNTFIDTSNVDWDLVAERLGLKNAKTASTRFGQVKKDLMECMSTEGASPAKNDSDGDSADDTGSPPDIDTPTPMPTPTATPTPPKTPENKVTKPKGRRGRPPKVKVVEAPAKMEETTGDTTDTEYEYE
ncbi:hypothetical protein TWF696_009306 [Orbilia brochopaga]|uniref:Uncharacterized protein n=1 Tax=Orbilia brochopaga TaxID=3140254 RepID=A0AAV9UIH1_9PEZI